MEGKKKMILLGAALMFILLAGVFSYSRDSLMGNFSQLGDTTSLDVSLETIHTDLYGFDIDTSNPNQLVKDVESYESTVSDNLLEAESHYLDGQEAVDALDLQSYYLAVGSLSTLLSDAKELNSKTEAILRALTRKQSRLNAEKESLESVLSSTSEDYDSLIEKQSSIGSELEAAEDEMDQASAVFETAKLNLALATASHDAAYYNYYGCLYHHDDDYNGECGEEYLAFQDWILLLGEAQMETAIAEKAYEEAVENYETIQTQYDVITIYIEFYSQGTTETDDEISQLTVRILLLGGVIEKVEAVEVRISEDVEIIQNYYDSLLLLDDTFEVDQEVTEEEVEDEKEEDVEEEDQSYDLSFYNIDYDEDLSELEIEVCATNVSSSLSVILLVSVEGDESANLITLDESGCPEASVVIELEPYEIEDSAEFEVYLSLNESKLAEESDQSNNFESVTFIYESLSDDEEEEEVEEEEEESSNDLRYSHPFYDVTGHWGESYVDEAYGFGWVQGTGGGRFEPNRFVNTAEYIKLMAETKGYESYTVSESEFTIDIPSWLEKYLLALEAKDVIRVRDGLITHFANEISRCDAALYLARLYEVEHYLEGSSTGFTDVDSSLYCAYAIVGLNELGVINGYPDGSFHPENTLTRAEALSLLMNARNLL